MRVASKLFSINSLRPRIRGCDSSDTQFHSPFLFAKASSSNHCKQHHLVPIPLMNAMPLTVIYRVTIFSSPFQDYKAFESFYTKARLSLCVEGAMGAKTITAQLLPGFESGPQNIYNYLSLLWKIIIILKIWEDERKCSSSTEEANFRLY